MDVPAAGCLEGSEKENNRTPTKVGALSGRVVATIQARMRSSRLPGKVMREAAGKPLLGHMIERVRRAERLSTLVVATSTNPSDDAIAQLCRDLNIPCFRGSEDDVLGRVLGALQEFGGDLHVELMGDSPVPEPRLIDRMVEVFLAAQCDYVSNGLAITFPAGIEVRVYPTEVLARLAATVTDPADREFVSAHIAKFPGEFRMLNVEAPPALRRPELHLEVDEPADFEVIAFIYESLYPNDPRFGLEKVLELMDRHPDIAARNRDIARRWKAHLTTLAPTVRRASLISLDSGAGEVGGIGPGCGVANPWSY